MSRYHSISKLAQDGELALAPEGPAEAPGMESPGTEPESPAGTETGPAGAENPGFLSHLEEETAANTDYRRVLFTTPDSQLVLMSVAPGDEIGEETHDLDQFIRFESGEGRVVLDDFEAAVKGGDSISVPRGVRHNVINTSDTEDLKLYAVYSPPQHKRGTVHRTKADETEEHFDGETDTGQSAG